MKAFHGGEKWLGKLSLGLSFVALLGFTVFSSRDVEARERDSRVRERSRGDIRDGEDWKTARGERDLASRADRRIRPRYNDNALSDLYDALNRIERINRSRRSSYEKERKISKIVDGARERLFWMPVRDYQTHYECKMALRKIERVNRMGRSSYAKQHRINRVIYQTRERLDRMSERNDRRGRTYKHSHGKAVPLG